MVRLRLSRHGRKGRPFYRIMVADARSPRDGRCIETIGYYDPLTEPATVVVNAEKALFWLSQGAQPSDAVARLLERAGIQAAVPAAPEPPPTAAEPPGEEA